MALSSTGKPTHTTQSGRLFAIMRSMRRAETTHRNAALYAESRNVAAMRRVAARVKLPRFSSLNRLLTERILVRLDSLWAIRPYANQ